MTAVPTFTLSSVEIEIYARAAHLRHEAHATEWEARRLRAWEVARAGAVLLKNEFGAQRVALFGSLLRGPGLFYSHSDVDLAVWGLPEKVYFRAVGRLLDLDPTIRVDLIEVEFASPTIRSAIERDGIAL